MNKIRKTMVMVGGAISGVLVTATAAFASPPPDPTGGAAADLSSDVSTWVTTYGIPAMVTLIGLGLIVNLLVRFARKGAKAAG
jgi:hypothetical protein